MADIKPAVFIDRDGTLIEFESEPTTTVHIRPFPFSAEAVKRLNDMGYLVIVHTNQPIIEKGIITKEEADALNEYLRGELAKGRARIDGFYTCPHRYKAESDCACRKPNAGLIEQAQKDFPIDMGRSWLVGDTTRDMETGRRVGLKSILVKTGKAGGGEDAQFFETKGDFEAEDLNKAVDIIEKAGR